MANKINEIIEVINNESIEGLTDRVDNLEDELGSFEESTNESIGNLAGSVDEVESDVNKLKNPDWYLPRDTDPIFDFQHKNVLCDTRIEFHITYRYSLPDITGDKTVRLLKTVRLKKGDVIDSLNSILEPISIFDMSTSNPIIGYTLLNIKASSLDYGIQHTSSQINLTLATYTMDTITEHSTINTNIIPIWYQYGDAGQDLTEVSYINVYADRNQIES